MEITKEQFKSFVKVQKSGVTNMFDTKKVSELSGLDKLTIMEIVRNYLMYKEKFGK